MAQKTMKKDTLLTDLVRGYQAAKKSHKPNIDRRAKNFQLFTGRNPKRKYKSKANFHVPYIATLLENVWPLLVSRLPISDVSARNDARDGKAASLMQELVKYTFDVNKFDFKFIMGVKDAMLSDTGWFKVIWEYQDEKTDHPKIEKLEPDSVLTHPRKVDIDDRWPIFQRAELTKSQMREMGHDARAINRLGESELGDDSYRKQRLEQLGIVDVGEKDDLYEVVEAWLKIDLSFGADENAKEEMACVVIANNQEIINAKPLPGKKKYQSPYDHGMYPFVWLPYDPFSNSMLSQSFIDPVASQQEELNALENMKADNYKLRNNPPFFVKRDGENDITTYRFEAGLPWLVEDPQKDIVPFIIPDLATSIENQQNMIKRQMQDRTGANDVLLVSGDVGIQGGDTATGAALADQNTKIRFRTQALLIDMAIKRVGEIIIGLFQQPTLFDRPKAIAIADDEGKYYEKKVSPEDIKGDLQFMVTASSSIAESKLAQLEKYINIKTIYAEDESVNQDEIDNKIFDAADLVPSKVKKDKETKITDLSVKLRELIALTKRPEFAEASPQDQAKIMAQIKNMRDILVSYQGGASENAETPAPTTGGQPTG